MNLPPVSGPLIHHQRKIIQFGVEISSVLANVRDIRSEIKSNISSTAELTQFFKEKN